MQINCSPHRLLVALVVYGECGGRPMPRRCRRVPIGRRTWKRTSVIDNPSPADIYRFCSGTLDTWLRSDTTSQEDGFCGGPVTRRVKASLLQSPAYRSSDSGRLLYFGRVLFFSHHGFFDVLGPIFAKLCHMTRCVLKYFISYMGVHMCPTLWAPPFPNAGKIRKSKTIMSICGYVKTSIPNMVGVPSPTPEIGCPLGVWGGTGKLWIDITSAVWQLATRCLIL